MISNSNSGQFPASLGMIFVRYTPGFRFEKYASPLKFTFAVTDCSSSLLVNVIV